MSNKEAPEQFNQSINLDGYNGYYVCQGCGKIIKEKDICNIPPELRFSKNSLGGYIFSCTLCPSCVLIRVIEQLNSRITDKSTLSLIHSCFEKILLSSSGRFTLELLATISNFKFGR